MVEKELIENLNNNLENIVFAGTIIIVPILLLYYNVRDLKQFLIKLIEERGELTYKRKGYYNSRRPY